MKHFCPRCWSEVSAGTITCPQCGYGLTDYERLDFEERLLLATRHPVREHQMIAVQVLGQRRSPRALPRFAEILSTSNDPYLCLEVLRALSNYNRTDALPLIEAATHHRSRLVARRAGQLRADLAGRSRGGA